MHISYQRRKFILFYSFILFYFIKIIIAVVTLFICSVTVFSPPSFSFVNVGRMKMEENE
jgi:hypothetical protein